MLAVSILIIAGLATCSTAYWESSLKAPSSTPVFTYNRTHFLLNGQPYQIIGGQMDPQRIPHQYWRDRLKKARAMGLNTIFPYIFWNLLEPKQGTWANSDGNNITNFFRMAQEEGLNIVLRPGPYICGERDWGGFPAWLANIPGMVVRSYNQQFLNASRRYIERLANDLREMQSTRGGPILMVQVENEYGSFGRDHNYTAAIRDILRDNFDTGTVLYTNDGGVDWTLEGGSVPGVLAEVDGDPASGFSSLRKYITDPSQKGPLLDGEYYTTGADVWGADKSHSTSQGRPDAVAGFVRDLDYVLGTESASISLYMFHGGTNFGFHNGALWQNRTVAFTTSYDYGSPLDESGRTTELYNSLRETFQRYAHSGSIPNVPANVPRMTIAQFSLKRTADVFDNLGGKTSAVAPMTMEALGQDYGFTLYEHLATATVSGTLLPGDRARDRVLIFVNGKRIGIVDSQYQHPPAVTVSLKPGDVIQLFVENLGRVDYYSRESQAKNYVQDPYKGILGEISIGDTVLQNWNMYAIPLSDISAIKRNPNLADNGTFTTAPAFYEGTFRITENVTNPMGMDTYLSIPAGVRGNIWVNGFHLGRYWRVGPQQSLYLPGTLLSQEQDNHVFVLELEPDRVKGAMVAQGLADRVWGNNPDEDCLRCS